ncbi:otoancorin [Limanda limanda]|uniref:otoancorin n=1 Tax=Limanda limanda TaxID=27771 RepID=UPI0029C61CDC|nr:otoancorin [Limanda limanda]
MQVPRVSHRMGNTNAKPYNKMPGKLNFKNMAQKLMMKCQNMGYQMPQMFQQSPVFNYRQLDLPVEEKSEDSSSSNVFTFLDALKLATEDASKAQNGRVNMADSDETPNKMWNCTRLQQMIRLMRNSSEASACYMQAVVAPMSWTTLTTPGENNMDPGEYDAMVWAAKPALQDMPPSRLNLPREVKAQYMEKIMNMMRDMHDSMSDHQRGSVVKWVKEQITQNYFNCTMMPPSVSGGESKSESMERCNSSLKWLNLKAMKTFGPYLSRLTLHDVDSSPREMLCEFFKSDRFTSTLTRMSKMKPSLSRKFLERIQECYGGSMELANHTDKLGTLACYYDAPDLTPDLSKKLLSQLDNCNNPTSRKLRKRLVQTVMSDSNSVQSVHELGSSVTLLSPKQLSKLPDSDREAILKTMGPNVRWSKSQLMALLKAKQDGNKCKEVTLEELMTLQAVVEGLPRCMLKRIRGREMLDDPDALRNITKRMSRGQLKAMLMGLRKDVNSSELLSKLSDPLLRVLSLNVLRKTNSTFLDQVEKRNWSQSQAAYLANKMHDKNRLNYWSLRSVLQGVTCKMIGSVADKDSLDMAQAITENPQWLSKVQAMCASRKLFATLKKVRADYFPTITEEELNDIPTLLLLHLPPAKVKDLPDSVCPVFLDKMEVANMSSLPRLSSSRPALLKRALRCLSKDLSELTTDDVSRLGELVCQLSASQLRLMNPDVTRSSLQEMASCLHIPQRHRTDLVQLLIQTYKDPSDWSAETMEALGPLLFLDDNATSALPNKPWMKDVLYFLKSRLPSVSGALKKKLFDLTITPPSNSERRKRAGEEETSSPMNGTETPTILLVEALEMGNVFWTPAEMDKLTEETFVTKVETLGRVPDYSAEQLSILRKKATEFFGPVSQMNESVVMQMRCLTRGFSNTELETLSFSLDAMEDITDCGWMESQMESVWMGVAKYNNLTAEELGAAEMVMLNQFICGLNQSEIKQLDKEAFKDAVGSVGESRCPYPVARQLKSLAVSAFGEPSTWNEARVSDLGNIMAGLDRTELASLKESVCPFFSKNSIPLIPADNFAGLSASQLEALGPDNAVMVTPEQLAALGDKQRVALQRAATGSQEETQNTENTSESGVPSLSVEGISAFMKPFLVFLIGLLFL